MEIEPLINLKNIIENMDAFHHKEILKILINNNVNFSENRNGIFLNLINIEKSIINKIKKYIDYVENQEKDLKSLEQQKKEYKDTYFT